MIRNRSVPGSSPGGAGSRLWLPRAAACRWRRRGRIRTPTESVRDEPTTRCASRRPRRHRDQPFDALGGLARADEETLSRLIEAFGLPNDPIQAAPRSPRRSGRRRSVSPRCISWTEEDPARCCGLRCPGDSGRMASPARGRRRLRRTQRGRRAALRGLAARLSPSGDRRGGGTTPRSAWSSRRASCHLPEALQPGARSWGLTVQLYGLRGRATGASAISPNSRELCRRTGPLGGAVVGVNPLHALFAAEPRHFSPYSPSSRPGSTTSISTPRRCPGSPRTLRRRRWCAGGDRGGARPANWSITPRSRR